MVLEADARSFIRVAAGLLRLQWLRPDHRCADFAAFLAGLRPLNVHVCVGFWQRHMQPACKHLVSSRVCVAAEQHLDNVDKQ